MAQKKAQPKKKADPVARFQNMQNQWQRNSFLKSSDNKQGRKLELDRFHKWSSLVHAHNSQTTTYLTLFLTYLLDFRKKGQVHKFIANGKAPTEDRRDDLRFQLRAKISQKDYVDKQMRAFHYKQEIAQKQPIAGSNNGNYPVNLGGGEDQLEQLKKQIENLKRGIQ